MVKTTLIARASDGLPLAASMDDEENEDLTEFKALAKQLVRQVSSNLARTAEEPRCTVEAGSFVFHYTVDAGVCYLVLAEKTYPKRLAFSYLAELQREFQEKHGAEVVQAVRPYSFIKFDSFIQKTKRQYKDSRSQSNMARLNEDLQDVQRIMTRNIQEVLGRQDALNRMSEQSGQLRIDSQKYLKDTKNLNWQALYRKYGPPSIVIGVVLLVLYIRFSWF